MTGKAKEWDLFLSHASEDKDTFARPLALALSKLGASVWYDEFSLRIGDSLSRSIDKGLRDSTFGVVVISLQFLGKPWPEYELRGLVSREIDEDRVILPIWHGVSRRQVVAFSPPLADKVALKTEGLQAEDVAIQVLREVRPDLYGRHPRAELERLASGDALRTLQEEIERTRDALAAAEEELGQYKCPYCGSALVARFEVPLDEEQKHSDTREEFECGHETVAGFLQRPCPKDPKFPPFEDYELRFQEIHEGHHSSWRCYPRGTTEMAQRVSLPPGYGETREEAEQKVREYYGRGARRRKA